MECRHGALAGADEGGIGDGGVAVGGAGRGGAQFLDYARVGGVEDLILPAPTEVARALWEDRSLLWDNLRVTAGEVRSDPAALMPQRDGLLPWLSALDNAGLALRVAGRPKAEARAAAHQHFEAFGLEGFERTRPAALSGGMRQRVAFLRTLLAGRPVLCLDEPFGALDALTRLQMQAWLADALAREPRTVLLVTHDVEEAVLLADRVVLLSPRPARVVVTLAVDPPRPRHRGDAEVVALREHALSALGAA